MLSFYPTFPVNTTINQTDYYFFKNHFSSQEIELILELADKYEKLEATVGGGEIAGKNHNIRNSQIRWLPAALETEWIYDRLIELSIEANDDLWRFDLSHVRDSVQYTEYSAGKSKKENGKYDWHLDVGSYPGNTRKISISVQLSDPEDYEGGELELWNDSTPTICPKGQGTVILFPSYLMHRVAPVTKGTRKSLVLWVGGRPFR
jgi:PKHD-type hydroxylase